jgi:hypothetical protein
MKLEMNSSQNVENRIKYNFDIIEPTNNKGIVLLSLQAQINFSLSILILPQVDKSLNSS